MLKFNFKKYHYQFQLIQNLDILRSMIKVFTDVNVGKGIILKKLNDPSYRMFAYKQVRTKDILRNFTN